MPPKADDEPFMQVPDVDWWPREKSCNLPPIMTRSFEPHLLLSLVPEDYFVPFHNCGSQYMSQAISSAYTGLPSSAPSEPPKPEKLLLSFDGDKQSFISADSFVPRKKKLPDPGLASPRSRSTPRHHQQQQSQRITAVDGEEKGQREAATPMGRQSSPMGQSPSYARFKAAGSSSLPTATR